MKSCPHDIAAWRCTHYLHSMGGGKLCRDWRRFDLSDEQDKRYCGSSTETCKGYKIDKRFKRIPK